MLWRARVSGVSPRLLSDFNPYFLKSESVSERAPDPGVRFQNCWMPPMSIRPGECAYRSEILVPKPSGSSIFDVSDAGFSRFIATVPILRSWLAGYQPSVNQFHSFCGHVARTRAQLRPHPLDRHGVLKIPTSLLL